MGRERKKTRSVRNEVNVASPVLVSRMMTWFFFGDDYFYDVARVEREGGDTKKKASS